MKWFIAGVTLTAIGVIAFFTVLFIGPHMNVQQHLLAYQRSMPLPPPGVIPVEPDRFGVPPPGETSALKNPLPDTAQNLQKGKIYYRYYCLFCHGSNGQGDGPVGYSYMPAPADLHDPNILGMSDGELLRRMLLGTGHEPVLARVVQPEHRWYIVAYLRELGKGPRTEADNPGALAIER